MSGVFFGEALLRFSTARGERLNSARQLDFHIGGTELNIAANLKALGTKSTWVSVLPENPLGDLVLDRARTLGVATQVKRAAGDIGYYLLETGATPRPDRVPVRVSSVLARKTAFDLNWREIFKGASFFHTSGVTAGLSEACTNEIARAMAIAREMKIKVSYDFNYRRNLWSMEESIRRQAPFLEYIDVLFCSAADLEQYFKGALGNRAAFEKSKLSHLVVSQRSENEDRYTIEVLNSETSASSTFPVQIVDRIGMGDAMAAGFWQSFSRNSNLENLALWSAACGAYKATILGDMCLATEAEIQAVIDGTKRGVIR